MVLLGVGGFVRLGKDIIGLLAGQLNYIDYNETLKTNKLPFGKKICGKKCTFYKGNSLIYG